VNPRRALRRLAGLAATATVFVVSGCGSNGNISIGPNGAGPAIAWLRCEQPPGKPSGMQVLMAQSVPTASAVPCLRSSVDNWTLATFDVSNGRSMIKFAYQEGTSETVIVEMTPRCDMRGATEVSSEQSGMRRYDREVVVANRYSNERYYVYPDACTSVRFDLAGTGTLPALRGAEVTGALGFIGRDVLDREVRQVSDGHLHLDPDRS
jgi:hypothetical protein